MSLGSSPSIVPLGRLKGMPLKAIEVYQTEECLNFDVQFEDGHVLEVTFRVGFQVTGTVLKWERGNSHVVQRITPRQRAQFKPKRTMELQREVLPDLAPAS
jgi:hypothetical protein